MKLTDRGIKNLKPKKKSYKKSDGGGLFLLIKSNGRKYWRQSYRFPPKQKNSKQKTISHGEYPFMSLAEARVEREEAYELISKGIDPAIKKLQDKEIKNTPEIPTDFKTIFFEWQDMKKHDWTGRYTTKMLDRMKKDVFPAFEAFEIENITPQMVIGLLKKIERRGVSYSAKRIRQDCSRVFKYAVGMGYTDRNPFGDLPLDIFKTSKTEHFATILDPHRIGKLLHDMRHYKGSFEVVTALRLLPHIFLRASELAKMTWDEVDIEARQVRIKAERMKSRKPHIVPMSDQVLTEFETLKQLNGDKDYVFWSPVGNGSINPESLRMALRRMGYGPDEITTHGFRHMASTRLNELGFRSDLIELQLAHRGANQVRATYNHAELLLERKVMLQKWSNYLDSLTEHYPA
jgi:integrase